MLVYWYRRDIINKRENVIEVARNLFTKYGYKKVSMDEIAREAKVTKKTIYSYFKDKDAMFRYFLEEELEKMKIYIEEKEKKHLSFVDIIASSVYYMLLFRKNSALLTTISDEVKISNTQECINFLKLYDEEIINYIEDRIKKEIEVKNIKNCDAHLMAFIIYKIYIAVLFEYDRDIDEVKVTKEVSSILKEGLFN